jgi:hypothetical protein
VLIWEATSSRVTRLQGTALDVDDCTGVYVCVCVSAQVCAWGGGGVGSVLHSGSVHRYVIKHSASSVLHSHAQPFSAQARYKSLRKQRVAQRFSAHRYVTKHCTLHKRSTGAY